MKHATPQTLQLLSPLLQKLRQLTPLRERKPGVFYRKSTPFIHFHEDPKGIVADLRTTHGWSRLPVTTATQCVALLRTARRELSSTSNPKPRRKQIPL